MSPNKLYRRALLERTECAIALSDAFSHHANDDSVLTPLLLRVERLERVLVAYPEYRNRDAAKIWQLEDERIHTPPGRPLDHQTRPCAMCRRRELGLPAELPLPARGVAG